MNLFRLQPVILLDFKTRKGAFEHCVILLLIWLSILETIYYFHRLLGRISLDNDGLSESAGGIKK